MSKRIGFTTATLDMIHCGHIEYLKACKALLGTCSLLVVGLTTDELAVKQKRKTLMSYEQRRDILIEFPFVDVVIPHHGQSKREAWEQIHYTDLFIEQEYRGSPEYSCMESVCKVFYVPGPLRNVVSSTALTAAIDLDTSHKFKVLANGGPSGLVFEYDGHCQKYVIKPIRITAKEYGNTKNVYHMPVPPPRNWKKLGEQHIYPNIPGVNGMREIQVHKLLSEYKWFPFVSVDESYSDPMEVRSAEEHSDFSHINADKMQYARSIYLMYQLHSGQSLASWIELNEQNHNFVNTLNHILYKLKYICNQLSGEGVVHGDLHDRNICVSPVFNTKTIGKDAKVVDYNVSLIDFGWCLARNFQLENDEQQYLEECLASGWDYQHFKDSMEYAYHTQEWFRGLDFLHTSPKSL